MNCNYEICLAVGYGVIVAPIYLAVCSINNVHILQEFSGVFGGTLWQQTSECQLFLSPCVIVLSNSVCAILHITYPVIVLSPGPSSHYRHNLGSLNG